MDIGWKARKNIDSQTFDFLKNLTIGCGVMKN
jgi:hypothetical protein